jgi:hypothetical protein
MGTPSRSKLRNRVGNLMIVLPRISNPSCVSMYGPSIELANVSVRGNYGLAFCRTHQVSQATCQAALDHCGAQGLTELTTLMGSYALLAFNANAFEIDLPADRTAPVLPIERPCHSPRCPYPTAALWMGKCYVRETP